MAKILLVEDDNNLREIYEARLQAEGYDIVSARDGEEALTVAMKERPDLIISDVMMPKISGFDMLDIIRSTEETKNSKVIMMTALSQAEDKERASKLGADRYLVKSQVTLEDVAKVAREVLEGEASTPPPSVQSAPASESESSPELQTPTPAPAPAPEPQTTPTEPAPLEDNTPALAPAPETPSPSTNPAPAAPASAPAEEPTAAPTVDPAAAVSQPPTTDDNVSTDGTPVTPTQAPPTQTTPSDDSAQSDDGTTSPSKPNVDIEALGQSVKDEEKAIAAQIESFIDSKKSTAPQSDQAEEATEEKPAEAPAQSAESSNPPKSPQSSDSESTKKKVIQPLNDPRSSSGPDLNALLKKEEEKEQMAQIAKEISSNPHANEAADELSAEAAIRAASRKPHPDEEVPAPKSESEVKIGEDGNLEAPNAQSQEEPTPVEKPADTPQPMNSEANSQLTEQTKPEESTPTTPVQQPPVQTEPVIPHTNGTSIDGVTQAPQPTQSSQQTDSLPQQSQADPSKPDPNSIAL